MAGWPRCTRIRRSPVVPAGGLLRGLPAGLPRLQRRRQGDLRGLTEPARLLGVAGDRLPLAAALLPVAAARRRLRHLRLLHHPARLRRAGRRRRARRGGPHAGPAGRRRPGAEPHQRPAPVVPGEPPGPGQPQGRLVRLGRRRPALVRGPDHLPRHRALQLELGPGAPAVLLAPLLRPPARPQLPQPRRPAGRHRHGALLARHRPRRLPPRRRALPLRGRRHQRREPPRDLRASCSSCGRRSTPATRASVLLAEANQWPSDVLPYFGRRRRVPHVLQLPAHAPHVPRGQAGRTGPDRGGSWPRCPRSCPRAASGVCSCATTTS